MAAPRLAKAEDAPATPEPSATQLDVEPIADDGTGPVDEVVVTVARRAPVSASESRVTARDFSFVPRRTAEDALKLVPGLTLVQHGSEGKGHQFFLRGFDAIHGADLELEVDGIPVNEWSNIHAQGYIDLGFVIPEVIAAVDVIKGPFSIDQGAFAMAGTARYTLGVPHGDLGLRASYTAGTTNRQRGLVTYSPITGDGTTFIAAEALHDDGFGQNRGIDRAVVLGRANLVDSDRLGTLSAIGSLYFARFELPGALRGDDVESGARSFYDSYDRGAHGDSGRVLAGLSYRRENEGYSLDAGVFAGYRSLGLLENFTGYLLDPVQGDRREQAQTTRSFGTHLDLALPLSPRVSLHTGLGVRGDGFDQRQDHVDGAADFISRERQLSGYQALFFAKAGAMVRPFGDVSITGGARVDVARVVVEDGLAPLATAGGSGTSSALSPRLALAVPLSPALGLFAAYGRGFRPPEARAFSSFAPVRTGIADDVYTGGEPRMTTTDSFELGARLEDAARRLGAVLSLFATFIERESIYDHVSGTNLELNGTRRLGGELELHGRFGGWLELNGFATLVDAQFVQSGNPVPLAPQQTAGFNAMAGRELGPRGGLRALYVAPRPLPHGARGATLVSVDATGGWYWERVHIDIDVENVLNRRLREGEYHYASQWDPTQPASQIPVLEFVAGPPLNVRASISIWF